MFTILEAVFCGFPYTLLIRGAVNQLSMCSKHFFIFIFSPIKDILGWVCGECACCTVVCENGDWNGMCDLCMDFFPGSSTLTVTCLWRFQLLYFFQPIFIQGFHFVVSAVQWLTARWWAGRRAMVCLIIKMSQIRSVCVFCEFRSKILKYATCL